MRRIQILGLVCSLALATAAHAEVATVHPVRDNTLYQDADGDTSNGAGPAIYAGRNGQNLSRRALLAFDLAGVLPQGASLDSARLTLRVSSAPDTVSRRFSLHRVLASWGEGQSYNLGGSGAPATAGDATWLHRFYPASYWTAPGGDFEPAISATTMVGDVGDYSWTGTGIAADVRAWLEQPAGNFGWLVQGEESVSRSVRRFDSRETDLPENLPSLTLYYSLPAVPTSTPTWGSLKARYR